MNQLCRVCGETAAGFHFGAFTCEGCKSFFGRTHSSGSSSLGECKTSGRCVINRRNRTACKKCRLQKCIAAGMSKTGSRYGRRSNWFKIHCLLQEHKETSNRKENKLERISSHESVSDTAKNDDVPSQLTSREALLGLFWPLMWPSLTLSPPQNEPVDLTLTAQVHVEPIERPQEATLSAPPNAIET